MAPTPFAFPVPPHPAKEPDKAVLVGDTAKGVVRAIGNETPANQGETP